MLTFQEEEILKGEKKIRHWQLKFVGLQSRIDNNLSNISEQFEDLLLSLDEMKIKVEELKKPGIENFEKITMEINKIDNRIELEFGQIQKRLFI